MFLSEEEIYTLVGYITVSDLESVTYLLGLQSWGDIEDETYRYAIVSGTQDREIAKILMDSGFNRPKDLQGFLLTGVNYENYDLVRWSACQIREEVDPEGWDEISEQAFNSSRNRGMYEMTSLLERLFPPLD